MMDTIIDDSQQCRILIRFTEWYRIHISTLTHDLLPDLAFTLLWPRDGAHFAQKYPNLSNLLDLSFSVSRVMEQDFSDWFSISSGRQIHYPSGLVEVAKHNDGFGFMPGLLDIHDPRCSQALEATEALCSQELLSERTFAEIEMRLASRHLRTLRKTFKRVYLDSKSDIA